MAQSSDGAVKPAPTARKIHAGRNLWAAIGVGVFLAGLVVFSMLVNPIFWTPVLAIASAIVTIEVSQRMGEAGIRMPLIPLFLGTQAVVWLTYLGSVAVLAGLAGVTLVCFVWRLFLDGGRRAPQNFLRDTSITTFFLLWLAVPVTLAAMMPGQSIHGVKGTYYVLTFILCVVCSDVGGYTAGVLFGRHPMVPSVSPKKSWEGFTGSVITGQIGGILSAVFLLHQPIWVGSLLGLLFVITATLGDLIESQIKRDLGIKDMGKILPGHGGMSDRIDGMLPAAVVMWIVTLII